MLWMIILAGCSHSDSSTSNRSTESNSVPQAAAPESPKQDLPTAMTGEGPSARVFSLTSLVSGNAEQSTLAVDPKGRLLVDSSFDWEPPQDSKDCLEDGYGAKASMLTLYSEDREAEHFLTKPLTVTRYRNCEQRTIKNPSKKILANIDQRLPSADDSGAFDRSAFSSGACRDARLSFELSLEIEHHYRAAHRFTAGPPGTGPASDTKAGTVIARVSGTPVATWKVEREIVANRCVEAEKISRSMELAVTVACTGDVASFAIQWLEPSLCWKCEQSCSLNDYNDVRGEETIIVDLKSRTTRVVRGGRL